MRTAPIEVSGTSPRGGISVTGLSVGVEVGLGELWGWGVGTPVGDGVAIVGGDEGATGTSDPVVHAGITSTPASANTKMRRMTSPGLVRSDAACAGPPKQAYPYRSCGRILRRGRASAQKVQCLGGAGAGNRTPDLLLTMEALCRLSYSGGREMITTPTGYPADLAR